VGSGKSNETAQGFRKGQRESVLIERIVRRYARLRALSEYELGLLRGLGRSETHPAGTELCSDGDHPAQPRIIIEGWAARLRVLPDGRRQIFAFLIPGDGMGICARPNPRALSAIVALTPLQTVDATALHEVLQRRDTRCPGLIDAFAIIGGLDEAMLLDHIVRLGRHTAYERMAHLILDLHERLDAVGLVEDKGFALPLTQEVLADALGLSAVHVNRTLQNLRHGGLIELGHGRIKLLDPASLEAVSDFRQLQRSVSAA
jgi:CRP-like cAMP-binding protein